MALCHSIMLRTAMNQLSRVKYSCRYKKNWLGGLTFILERMGRSEFIAVSMLYLALYFAQNVARFIEESTGIIGVAGL